MRESQIEIYFTQRVKRLGGETRKVVWVCRRGAPDRVVMFPNGVLAWVELKATGKVPAPHQVREHERMREMGQRVEVIDSTDGVDEFLFSLGVTGNE